MLGININELTPNFVKSKNAVRQNLTINDKVWEDIKYEYSINYNNRMPYHLDKNYGDRYSKHNDRETVSNTPYYEPKENDEYYQKSRLERLKLKFNGFLKKLVRFFKDFSLFIFIVFSYSIFSGINEVKSYL